MKLIRYLLGLSLFLLAGQWVKADETAAESFNPQKSIFEHLGDEYGWNVWNLHIPLPVIVRDEEGTWHVFILVGPFIIPAVSDSHLRRLSRTAHYYYSSQSLILREVYHSIF